MNTKRILNNSFTWLLCLLCAGMLLYVIPAAGIYRRTTDIDVNSGLIRNRTSFLFIYWKEAMVETPVSKYTRTTRSQPNWERVSFEPIWSNWLPHLKVIYHPAYSGVLAQIETLNNLWSKFNYSENQRKVTAELLLKAWRENDNSLAGGQYVSTLWDEAK